MRGTFPSVVGIRISGAAPLPPRVRDVLLERIEGEVVEAGGCRARSISTEIWG